MGIDPSRLAPWAQAQIARKLAAQMRDKAAAEAAAKADTKRKYHNTPTDRDGAEGKKIRFDSQKEAKVYDELMIRLQAGRIRDLKLQPQFTLQEAYTTPDGTRVRAIRYVADFSFYDCDNGRERVWDVKSKATKTRVYAIKRKLMMERFEIEVEEIE